MNINQALNKQKKAISKKCGRCAAAGHDIRRCPLVTQEKANEMARNITNIVDREISELGGDDQDLETFVREYHREFGYAEAEQRIGALSAVERKKWYDRCLKVTDIPSSYLNQFSEKNEPAKLTIRVPAPKAISTAAAAPDMATELSHLRLDVQELKQQVTRLNSIIDKLSNWSRNQQASSYVNRVEDLPWCVFYFCYRGLFSLIYSLSNIYLFQV